MSALDSLWTGATTIASLTPIGMALGVQPAGAPEGWGLGDTIEAVTGLDTSDRIDADDGGAVAATFETVTTEPLSVVNRGREAATELGTEAGKAAGFLPSWWRPWMSTAALVAGGLAAAAVVAGPYLAPMLAARRKG